VIATEGGATTRYTTDFRVDPSGATITRHAGVGLKVDPTGGGGGDLYYVAGDATGSVSVLIDAAGNVVQHVAYTPFGAIRSQQVFDPNPADGMTPHATDRLFNGTERDAPFDAAGDVYDFGPRAYLAGVGRWLQPDPRFEDGLNRYAFVRSDPIRLGDPTGFGGFDATQCVTPAECAELFRPIMGEAAYQEIRAKLRHPEADDDVTMKFEPVVEIGSEMPIIGGNVGGVGGDLKLKVNDNAVKGTVETQLVVDVNWGGGVKTTVGGKMVAQGGDPNSYYMLPGLPSIGGGILFVRWGKIAHDLWYREGMFEPEPFQIGLCDYQPCAYAAP